MTMEPIQAVINARQVILSTQGHVTLGNAASIIDTALDAGRPETYQLITNIALIAAEALATTDPKGWAKDQERAVLIHSLLQLAQTPAELLEPPC